MIHYTLTCEQEHVFEGWFRSSADFDGQVGQGLVTCPVCGSTAITRAPMAPNVQSARGRESRAEAAAPRQTVMVPDQAQKMMLEALREIRRKVTESADYVGEKFAEEARKMHYGEAELRGIWGEATSEEASSLADEGIEFQPLPGLPEDRN